MNNQMIVLASKFLEEIKEFTKDNHGTLDCEPHYKKEVLNDIGEILAGGSITASQLNTLFEKEKDNPQKIMFYKPCNILDHHKISYVRKSYHDPENLLVPGQFYYHPKLQLTPPPPVIEIHDDGTMIPSYDNEAFYLEIIDKITKRDLVDYFYNKMNMPAPEATLARDIGAIDHMLRFWDADFILYLIDEAFVCSSDSGRAMPRSPLDIQAFDNEALAVYEARKNTCFEEGLDRVIPRVSV